MHIKNILIGIIFSLFSTIVMSYISIATPIGPWIAPTLVLLGMIIFRLLGNFSSSKPLALVTITGSIGGILATGFGFSFPTLYFLDPILFNSWMAHPVYFISILTSLALAAGGFGMLIANVLEHTLIVQDELPFPIAQLVIKMIEAQKQIRKAYELAAGFVGTFLFCILQDGLFGLRGLIPKTIQLLAPMPLGIVQIPQIQFDVMPMLWAIGFVTGHVIAVPLLVGSITKIILADPLNRMFFANLSNVEFILSFGTGMVLHGTIISFFGLPKMVKNWIKNVRENGFTNTIFFQEFQWSHVIELASVSSIVIGFLFYFSFSLLVQSYLLLFTFACIYQIAVIAGKIGIAPLGRFATFVMVPAMFLFSVDLVQVVLIATFVEVAGGVTADILFGRKVARQWHIDHQEVKAYQYIGLIVSALCIGVVFWFLINNLQLGSTELFALKAKNRQLLVAVLKNLKNFNYWILLIGVLFSYVLKFVKVNPTLVLGGLLMPLNISLGLILGGLLTLCVQNREEWDPFWSGVFASNSIWMLIKSVLY